MQALTRCGQMEYGAVSVQSTCPGYLLLQKSFDRIHVRNYLDYKSMVESTQLFLTLMHPFEYRSDKETGIKLFLFSLVHFSELLQTRIFQTE